MYTFGHMLGYNVYYAPKFAHYAFQHFPNFLSIMLIFMLPIVAKIDQKKPLLDYHSTCPLCSLPKFFAYYAHFFPNIKF